MYKVFCDDVQLYNSRADDVKIISPVVVLKENSAGSFTFSIPKTHYAYNEIKKRFSIIRVEENKKEIFRGIAVDTQVDFFGNKKVECEGELTYLNDSIQRQARYQGETVRGLLKAFIDSHNSQVEEKKRFKVGRITVQDPNDSLYCFSNYDTTMKCLKEDLLDDLGGFISIRQEKDGKYLDYLTDADRKTNSQEIRLGINLLDYTSNIDTLNLATAVIPLGAKLEDSEVEGLEKRLDITSVNNGDDFVYSASAVNSYGWIYKTVDFDNITEAETLKKKGEHYLSEVQFENVSISAKAVDMSLVDSSIESLKIGDQVRIVSKSHGLDKYFPITQRTYHLDNPSEDVITLGKVEKLTLSAQNAQIADNLRKAIESIAPKDNVLNLAKENATALINGNGENGYVVLHNNSDGVPYEILLMDTPDIKTARRVWRWNNSGLGYSNTGYEGTYGLAMTIDGSIVADFVTTGIMSANRIRGGELTVGGNGTGRDGSILGYTANNTLTFRLDKNGAMFNGILEAQVLAGGVGKQLNDAINTANQALERANEAISRAQSTADTAQRSADVAQSAANTANTAIARTNQVVQQVQQVAQVANNAANTANSVASSANNKVDQIINGKMNSLHVGTLWASTGFNLGGRQVYLGKIDGHNVLTY